MAGPTLITGGSGLIGRWVRCQWPATLGELASPGQGEFDLLAHGGPQRMIEQHRPTRVIHLAWCASGTAGYRQSPNNERWLAATLELVRACDEMGVLLWLTGTGADEDATGHDRYVAAKHELRRNLSEALEQRRTGWLRPFHVFDPDAARPRLMADVLVALASGRPVDLQSPSAKHDFVHAADVGAAVTHVLQHDLRGVIDVGTGTLISVGEFVTRLGAKWRAARPGDELARRQESVADNSRLCATGWLPYRTKEFLTK